MTKNLLSIFTVLMFSGSILANTEYTNGLYDVDPAHTRVSFTIPHFVVSEVEGRFNQIKAEIALSTPFVKSSVMATVATASVDTGERKRDEHLRTAEFLDVAKYPQMKLVSKSIVGTPKSFKMIAALTIKDVTKDVEFDCKYTGSVQDSKGATRAAFQATAKISRKDFHINYNEKVAAGLVVGDEVKILLRTEGILRTAGK